MLDKRLDLDGFIASLRDGMTIGVGGWATRRKPMALVRAIARSGLKDLTIVAYGGPDVGVLVASGKVKKLIFGFVSLDHFPLDPHFRAARQAGTLEVLELDEGLLHWGLRAAAMHLPFLPARSGLATDIPSQGIRTVQSPYDDGGTLLAMPAIKLDAAIMHVHRSDQMGNALIFSPDPFFDDMMARAADKVFISSEQVVPTEALDLPANSRFHPFERSVVTGVIEAPLGAHPTGASPDYGIDMAHLKTYVGAASPEAWADYRARFIDVTPDAYLAEVGGADHVRALPAPIY